MDRLLEPARGTASTVGSYHQQRLEGAFNRHREWEEALEQPNRNWERRLAFEEWTNHGRFSDIQCEMTFWTPFRQLLELVLTPELVGVGIREAEKLPNTVETRKAVGKLIDGLKELGGAFSTFNGQSAVAKVINNSLSQPL